MTTLPRWASNSLQLARNSYADCGNPSILNGLQSYTLEAWVNLTTISGFQSVIGKINNGVDGAYQLFIQDGQVYSYYPTPPYVIMSPMPLTVNKWHHLATTYDSPSGTLILYVDGTQVARGKFPYTASTSAANALIGATLINGTPDWFLQGMVGEVMIWNVCRSAEDVLNDSVQISYQGDTAVRSLLMDMDFSSLPAADWAGKNIRVTLHQGANYCVGIPGLKLQGSAYANCGNTRDLSLGEGSYTIEGWFYPTSASGTIVSKFNASVAGEYSIEYADNRVHVTQYNMPNVISSAPFITPNSYYHFATTYDAYTTLLSLYINGNLQAAQYVTVMPSAPSVDMLIGAILRNGAPASFFQGYIQDIRIWSTCLKQNLIKQWMYNQPVIEPNLIASFDFTVNPPVESTGQHAIRLLNSAAFDFQMLMIAPDSTEANLGFIQSINSQYFSQNDVKPNHPPKQRPSAAPRERQFAPFTDGFKTAIWEDFEAMSLGDADEQMKENTRARFEEAYAKASEMVRQRPELLKVFTVKEENGMLSVIHHGVKGDTLILRAPRDEIDPCTLWFIKFTFAVTLGLCQALGLLPSFGDISTRVYNMLTANARVVAAFNSVLGKTITVTGGLTVVGVIYAEGYMWTLLKMAFTSAGWWVLAWILAKVVAFVSGVEAAVLVAGFIVWAGQLTVLSLDFNSTCGSTSIEPGEALPTPLTA
ncbi:MAG TPA: LamG domain-containing protein [Pyrinomonadaceae bacterium]|jgi:hypothetical protein